MVMLVVTAHKPASGVNVYVPVAVLLTVAGDQVPVIKFVEAGGNTGATSPAHKGGIWVKAGVGAGPTTMAIVTGVAHGFPVGVNV